MNKVNRLIFGKCTFLPWFFSDGSKHYDASLILDVNYEVTY